MRERIFIVGSLGLLVVALVGLNTATYVQKEKIPDSEAMPHRSTFNTGPTGTRAFHDLLVSTGQVVRRWERPISELTGAGATEISTFVIIGKTRREITDIEIGQLLEWVDNGGFLVLVDRDPPDSLLNTTGPWSIAISERYDAYSERETEVLLSTVDPANSKQMTDGEVAAGPLQPTPVALGVNAVQPSKFAASVLIARVLDEEKRIERTAPAPAGTKESAGSPMAVPVEERTEVGNENGIEVDPDAGGGFGSEPENGGVSSTESPPQNNAEKIVDSPNLAPVIHIGNDKKNLVAEFPYGYGSIAILTDPYMISNGGINLVDNAVLGLNLVSTGGTIAFDEFHQGYGSDQNRLLSYFSGTPVIPIFLQFCLLIGLLMMSQSRRFARPIPMREPNRLSKLEYVAAMAQLKQRTKAFDLAIENIYTDFRRRISRLAGLENSRSRNRDFAEWVAKRTDYSQQDVFGLIEKCEDIMHGEPTYKKEVLDLTTKMREIEKALGLRRGRNAFRK